MHESIDNQPSSHVGDEAVIAELYRTIEALQGEVVLLRREVQQERRERSDVDAQLQTARMGLMNLAKAHAERGRELEELRGAMTTETPGGGLYAAGSALGEAQARDLIDEGGSQKEEHYYDYLAEVGALHPVTLPRQQDCV